MPKTDPTFLPSRPAIKAVVIAYSALPDHIML
jgi:hypothetical protein